MPNSKRVPLTAAWINLKAARLNLVGAVILALISLVSGALGGAYWRPREHATPITTSSALPSEYEWQWAGEGWYGRVLLSGQGETLSVNMARVFELRKEYSDPKTSRMVFGNAPLLESLDGLFKRTASGNVNIDLLVNKLTHGHTGYVAHKISGQLAPVTCFAGKVAYKNTVTGERSKGDMILVNYESISDELTAGRFDPQQRYSTR